MVNKPVSLADLAVEVERELDEARKRQAGPGVYALMHANGMKWADLVALISGDAVLVSCVEAVDEEINDWGGGA